MDQAVQQPLDIHLDLASQREPVQALVTPDIGKHRLHYGQALRVDSTSRLGFDLLHNLFGETLANGNEQLFAFGTSSINAPQS